MPTADEQVIVGGQRALAVQNQEGSFIYDGGATDIQAIVATSHGAQRALKVVVLDGSGSPMTVDDALSATSTNPVQNKVVTSAINANTDNINANSAAIEAINDELGTNPPWTKPESWMDIRSGALPNSVYFFVGHSADYSTYPQFGMRCELSNSSGTYDVFVDGIKVAATAHNTDTTLNWQTLALTSGYDVTYPSALRTHIVRVAPTDSSHTITKIKNISGTNQGLLWLHSTLTYASEYQFGSTASVFYPKWEAFTCIGDTLKVKSLTYFAGSATELKYVPKLDATGITNPATVYSFYQCGKLPKVHLIGFNQQVGVATNTPFDKTNSLKTIITENCILHLTNFNNAYALEKLPDGNSLHNTNHNSFTLTNLHSLQDTIIDASDAITCKRAEMQGTSSNRCDGIKGLTVSNLAPFNGSSPQINVSYTGLDRAALINLFNSLPTVTASQVCNIAGATGAASLDETDLAIATSRGWTITR